MVRTKIQIKKIDNITTRQVTFSKRRRGLFKKAHELSTLCDAEIGLIVFSSTGKLHNFSSTRMSQVVQKYMRHTGNFDQLDPSLQPQEEDCVVLRKEYAEKNQELRLMKGIDLEGLSIEELTELEKQVERGYARVRQMKDNKRQKLIIGLRQKEEKLLENNDKLKGKITDIVAHETEEQNLKHQLGQSSEHSHIENNVIFDTSLRLGLV